MEPTRGKAPVKSTHPIKAQKTRVPRAHRARRRSEVPSAVATSSCRRKSVRMTIHGEERHETHQTRVQFDNACLSGGARPATHVTRCGGADAGRCDRLP